MTDSHDFPAEFPADPAGSGDALVWTAGVIVASALALALFNASAIANWTQDLPAGPRTARAIATAEAWNAETTEIGLDAPYQRVRHAWKRAKATPWPEKSGPE
ncbi:MAG TPA: hypothetical protein VI168_11460 [Croceibacterium sp.]